LIAASLYLIIRPRDGEEAHPDRLVTSSYQGTINSSVFRTAEIFRPAIIRTCQGLMLCHNHRGGDPTPKSEDIKAIKQLVAAGRILDIELVDHIIIGHQRFVSLKEHLRWK
jgi:DNA repair protein RadC